MNNEGHKVTRILDTRKGAIVIVILTIITFIKIKINKLFILLEYYWLKTEVGYKATLHPSLPPCVRVTVVVFITITITDERYNY